MGMTKSLIDRLVDEILYATGYCTFWSLAIIAGLSTHLMLLHANSDLVVIVLFYTAYPDGCWHKLHSCFTRHTPMVAGINYIPAEAKALTHEGGIGL